MPGPSMKHRARRISATLMALGVLVACQAGPTLHPAVLSTPDTETTIAMVKATLGEALGRTQVDFTPADLTGATGISALPLPLSPQETRSPALPTHFNIETDGTACFLVNVETGKRYALVDIGCIAADQ